MNNKLDDTFVIMGIDPGTNIMGFGIIKVEKKEMRLIDMIAVSYTHLTLPTILLV